MTDDKTRIRTTPQEPLISLAPGTRLAEYEIIKTLGIGGFGITYLARDTHLHKDVAVKEYFPTHLAYRDSQLTVHARQTQEPEDNLYQWGLDRVIQEARAIAQFDHPNLIRVARYFEQNGTAYIVMDFASGPSLKQMIASTGGLDESQFAPMLFQLMDGLEVVHAAEILHRDIKPINIIVRDGRHPVLIDFGAAKQTIGNQATVATAFQSMGFTPLEQLGSAGRLGPYTDIYALAATAYTAITGKPPADCNDRVIGDSYIPAVEAGKGRASEAFLQAIDWGLELKYQERPQTVAEWRAAFTGGDAAASVPPQTGGEPHTRLRTAKPAGRPSPAPAPHKASTPGSSAPQSSGLRPGWIVGGALAALLAIAGAWWLTQPSDPEAAVAEPTVSEPSASGSGASEPEVSEPAVSGQTAPADVGAAHATTVVTEVISADDQRDFDAARFIDTPEAYTLYLRLHPEGHFVAEARAGQSADAP